MNFISHFVVVAAWLSLRSFPPKEAMVAVVVTADIIRVVKDEKRREEMKVKKEGRGKKRKTEAEPSGGKCPA